MPAAGSPSWQLRREHAAWLTLEDVAVVTGALLLTQMMREHPMRREMARGSSR
jgi:hypothetical protein